jgi:hypothetical protein
MTLDVRTAPLTLDLRKNGQPLSATCIGDDIAGRVNFGVPPDFFGTGYLKSCTQPLLSVTQQPDPSTLPTVVSGAALFNVISYASQVRGPDVLVSGPTTRVIDLTLIPVTGRVLASGAPVPCSVEGAAAGMILFVDTGATIQAPARCSQGVVRYTAELPLRSYRAYFVGVDATLPLPHGVPAQVASGLQVTAATATIDFNTTSAPVNFTVTQNGAPVTCTATQQLEYYFEVDGLGIAGFAAPCVNGTGYRFTHRAMPGPATLVLGNYDNPNFPLIGDLKKPVTIGSTTTTLTVDTQTIAVAGTITVDGAPLTNCSGNNTVAYAVRSADRSGFELTVSCGASTTFSGRLPPGTYDFTFSVPSNEWPVGMRWEARLPAATSMPVALTTRVVTFDSLLNGAAPQSSCTGSNLKARYDLSADAMQGGTTGDARVDCSATGFSKAVRVFRGVSTVSRHTVAGVTLPSLQTSPNVLDSRTQSAFTFDSQARHLTGTLTVNGQAAGCVSSDSGELALIDSAGKPNRGVLTCLNGNWVFDFYASPGFWRVTASGRGGGLPATTGTVLTFLSVN